MHLWLGLINGPSDWRAGANQRTDVPCPDPFIYQDMLRMIALLLQGKRRPAAGGF